MEQPRPSPVMPSPGNSCRTAVWQSPDYHWPLKMKRMWKCIELATDFKSVDMKLPA